MFPPFAHACQSPDDKQCPGYADRRQGSCEDERTHAVHQVFAYRTTAHYVSPGRCGCLAKGAYQEVDIADAAFFFGTSQAGRAEDTEAVRFVHVQQYVVATLLQPYQFAQVGAVAVHAEYAFGDDDDAPVFIAMLVYESLQLVQVVVAVADAAGGCCQAYAVYQAGMYQFVC